MASLTAEEIIGFLDAELGVDTADLTVDSPLFSSALVDSFSLVELVAFLEERCSFRMPAMDVNLDNLDTVGRIVAYAGRLG